MAAMDTRSQAPRLWTARRMPAWLLLCAVAGWALAGQLGCETSAPGEGQKTEAPSEVSAQEGQKTLSPSEVAPQESLPKEWQPPQTKVLSEREKWAVCYSGDKKVGYVREVVRDVELKAEKLIQIERSERLSVSRFGAQADLEVRYQSLETPDGQPVYFSTSAPMGPMPVLMRGRVEGDRLLLRITVAGEARSNSLEWSNDYGGFYAPELSLKKKPMQPGETRTLKALVPLFIQVSTIRYDAKDYETVELLSGPHELLRIEQTLTLGGRTLRDTLWTDRTGEILKQFESMMKVTIYAATKELALDQTDAASLDVGWNLTVKVDRPLGRPHQAQRVRYRVRVKDDDPAAIFVSGPFQRVKSIDAHTAEITVYGRRPGMPLPKAGASKDRPTEADRQANSMIQSDDPVIVAMAKQAAPDEIDAEKVAVALEKHVHDAISQVDYSQAFASAVEVAKTRRGDCTEHAVLLAALCRARGIPARVALGLVYVEGARAFGYHAWTEAYVDGRWLGLDATRPHGGTSAAYLEVSHSSLEGAAAYASLLPIVQLAGRLEIEVLEAGGER